jgi:hypothetical protein
MVHMIVLTEVFLIFKHGKHDFSHATIPRLGYIFLGLLFTLFLTVLAKGSDIRYHKLEQKYGKNDEISLALPQKS